MNRMYLERGVCRDVGKGGHPRFDLMFEQIGNYEETLILTSVGARQGETWLKLASEVKGK